MDQSNALTNWEKQMARRRKQQGNLASKCATLENDYPSAEFAFHLNDLY